MKDYYLVRKGKLWVSDAGTTYDDMQAPFDVITVSGEKKLAQKFYSKASAKYCAEVLGFNIIEVKVEVKEIETEMAFYE
ncbi:hypothetical protein PDN49_29520 [Bacillus cereus]|uniref:Uncharacterized protein n=1 Tax=Bacillus thuringiensis TaxID=1428 RepID=A0A9W3YKW9_BACTU|nr:MULTISPECIES: hypothetical protein [Bacillus cereus group]AMR05984.1 hypothetical protein AXW78_28310 [Bacillus thuringiensis]AYF85397.1 hypothetical protein D7J84_31010 [Bacillus thuringiensis]MDA2331529.1 hypothetical protein [Bacillus cereus]MDA2337397.1 hypothetical protein [Bacillus cereus]MDA2358832.1 hypothetical protein [Bacillus cereus]